MAKANHTPRSFQKDEHANSLIAPLLTVIFAVIGALLVVKALAIVAPDFFVGVGDLVSALTGASTNSTLGDSVLQLMGGVVVGVVLVLGFVGLIFAATSKLGLGGGGKY